MRANAGQWQIRTDFVQAMCDEELRVMKSADKERQDVIRMINAAIKQREVDAVFVATIA